MYILFFSKKIIYLCIADRLVIEEERDEWDEEDWKNAELYVYKAWRNDWWGLADECNERNKLS